MISNKTEDFYKEREGIYRLKVPFGAVYTSVFLIETEEGDVLVDCATTKSDVDERIIPALQRLGKNISDIKSIVITHGHSDHAGGLAHLLERAPDIEVIRDIRSIAGGVETYSLPGHTKDLIGVFDRRSRTLITSDGLQGAGVGKYRCSTQDPEAYIMTLERIKHDEAVENILFSHAYEPWYKDGVIGRENVMQCLSDCYEYVKDKK